ncbi:MAG: hypothetical protein A2045_14835 [Rhodocyclales bacterium GWA2_65_20]|nr:MAG: hypothetical protein A2045_14835 [Rhodocyclales bacterium GWA2_65_20]
MKPAKLPSPRDAHEEISALIETLHLTGQRLEELTAGEVDAVADRGGRTFLLRHAQEQLRDSEAAKQAAILNALPAHIALLDAQGIIISVNEAWRKFAGANALQGPQYAIGVNYLDICDRARGDDAAAAQQAAAGIRSVLAGGAKSFSLEYPCHSPTQWRWFLMTVTPLAGNHLHGVVVMHLDITERKRAEQKFKDLLEAAPDAMVIVNRDSEMVLVNAQAVKLFGWHREDLLGQKIDILVPERFRGKHHGNQGGYFEKPRSRAMGSEPRLDLFGLRKDGTEFPAEISLSPLETDEGFLVISTIRDITERKQAAEEIWSLAKFPTENPSPVLRIGREGTILVANQSSAPILATWGRRVGQKVPDDWQKWIALAVESGKCKDVEIECDRKIFSCILTPILSEQYVNVYGRDITELKQAMQELRESERRFSELLQNVGLISVMLDGEARITYCNEYLLRLTGWRHEEVIGKNWFELFIPPESNDAKDVFAAVLASLPTAWHHENEILTRSGEHRLIRWNNSVLRSGIGDVIGTASIGEDITERKEAEAKIAFLNRVYAMLSGINTLIVRVRDRDELFREACRIAVDTGGFRMAMIATLDQSAKKLVAVASAGKDEELLTAIKTILSSSEDAPKTMVARAIREKKAVVANNSQTDPRVLFGKKYVESGVRSMAVLPLMVSDEAIGVIALYAGETGFFRAEEMKLLTELAGDIAFAVDHIGKQERLDFVAYYDELTGLANRNLFLDRVTQYMHSAAADGHQLAVILIDLERFKNINDSLGRPAGDALLRQVAEWLTRRAGDANLLARVGADHFAAVLPEVRQERDVARLIEKSLEDLVNSPFRLNDAVFRVAAKIGVALFPDDGADADTLFRNAEAALKKAKASSEHYLFYAQEMTAALAGKLTLENQLRQALDNGEFVLHYQPKVNLASGKMTSAEALIRWNDPRTGLVPPGRFIPILEETGLIFEVGRWALRQAIADYLRWRNAGLAAVRIAVNVSPLQLRNRGFVDEVRQVIGIDARASDGLELEITESLIMEDVKHSIASLEALRAMGICIAIDDFGTGFSSLSYLAKLPVHTLKIDRSFVIDMTAGPQGLALVSTIINLAHSLKLKVVAEGVETEEQRRLLHLLDCDEMQGYLFSKPVPGDTFETRFLAPHPVPAVS